MEESATQNLRAQLSSKWRSRFEILDRFATPGGSILSDMSSDAYQQLTRKERRQFSFNWPAVFLGFIYYAWKGMWKKSAIILALAFLLSAIIGIVEIIFQIQAPSLSYGAPIGMLCAFMANYDYYKYIEYGETMWPGLPRFLSQPVGTIATPLVAIFLSMGVMSYTPYMQANQGPNVSDEDVLSWVNGVWFDNQSETLIAVNLDQEGGHITTPSQVLPATINEIYALHDAAGVRISLEYNNRDTEWALEHLYEDEGLAMQLRRRHEGITILSFVDELEH